MFSIADLLERAKTNAHLESDYRLAKVLRINQTKLSNYRHGRNLPNVELIEALCALSGDDAGVTVAEVEAARAAEGPARAMWMMIAKRLQAGAVSAVLSVLIAIGLIAGGAVDARAGQASDPHAPKLDFLYIVSSAFLSVRCFALVRLRRFNRLLPAFYRLCVFSLA